MKNELFRVFFSWMLKLTLQAVSDFIWSFWWLKNVTFSAWLFSYRNEYLHDKTLYFSPSTSIILFVSRFQSALHAVDAAGEREKVLNGLFENYLLPKVKDPHMDLVCHTIIYFDIHIILEYQFSEAYIKPKHWWDFRAQNKINITRFFFSGIKA